MTNIGIVSVATYKHAYMNIDLVICNTLHLQLMLV